MDSHNNEPMSESVEMYLLRIALLQEQGGPVPLSALAEELSVSPVSANQMCRKLEERGMVHYEPYKGVRLTVQGEAVAMRVLRKRRLWEVFLTDKLGMEPHQAEDIACRFEHVTPDGLVEPLAIFLDNPVQSPQNKPIPPIAGTPARRPQLALAKLVVGQASQVVHVEGDATLQEYMRSQGVTPGASVKLLATSSDGTVLVEAGEVRVALASELARLITVAAPASH